MPPFIFCGTLGETWHRLGFFVLFFTFYFEDVLNSLDVAKIAQSVPGTLHSCPQGRRERMEEVFDSCVLVIPHCPLWRAEPMKVLFLVAGCLDSRTVQVRGCSGSAVGE